MGLKFHFGGILRGKLFLNMGVPVFLVFLFDIEVMDVVICPFFITGFPFLHTFKAIFDTSIPIGLLSLSLVVVLVHDFIGGLRSLLGSIEHVNSLLKMGVLSFKSFGCSGNGSM